MNIIAADIMSTELITATPDMGVRELAELFTQHKISGAPVVDSDGNLVGIVSQSDLVAQNKKLHIPTAVTIFDWVIYLEGLDKFKNEMNKIAGTTVEDIMTRKVVTVKPDTALEDIATLMTEKKVHTIPVLDGGRLVGVIGRLDIIRSVLR